MAVYRICNSTPFLLIINDDDKDLRYWKIAISFDDPRPIMQLFRRIRHRYYRETSKDKSEIEGY